ncbi:MAG: hypothetical protein ABIX10_10370 [Acidimicrobiales bacterium]
MSRLAGYLIAAVACTGVVGCADADDTEGATTELVPARRGPVLEEFQLADIAADPAGGGWLLEDVNGQMVVNHLDEEGELVKGAELPSSWGDTEMLGLADGRLAAVGVRCEPVEECRGSVVELAWVSADGRVSDPRVISTREAPPEDVSPRIGGSAVGLFWLSAHGDLFAVGDDGSVEQRSEGVGHPCVVDDGVYVLSESGRPETANPTADPEHPVTYSVSTVTDGKVAVVQSGSFEGPSNSLAGCVGSGFETYVSTKTESSRWTPSKGWFEVERALDPAAPRSTHALGMRGDDFIVDEAGSLVRRNEVAAWESTGITFDAAGSDDRPPLVLFADRSGDAVIGCVSIDASGHALECHAGRVP